MEDIKLIKGKLLAKFENKRPHARDLRAYVLWASDTTRSQRRLEAAMNTLFREDKSIFEDTDVFNNFVYRCTKCEQNQDWDLTAGVYDWWLMVERMKRNKTPMPYHTKNRILYHRWALIAYYPRIINEQLFHRHYKEEYERLFV